MKLLYTVALVSALSAAACARPTITSLDRTSGPPHTLVMIQGTDLDLGTVVWDADKATPIPIPGGFLKASMFSVPPMAMPGVHQVAVRNSAGVSATVPFTVDPPAVPFPKPAICSVTLLGADFDGSGHVMASLYVQGANFDVGAVVRIGGVDVATFSHKGLRNESYGVAPTEFGYPITHFVSSVAVTGTRNAGGVLAITVRNLDGQMSDPVSYTLPANQASMDSDGDGLLDSWETSGYDADGDGVVDVNLAALGAKPYRRDILVELDAMAGATATQPGLQYPLGASTFSAARAMFDAAPFLNPMGVSGINLILDTSETLPFVEIVCFDLGTASGCADNPSLGIAKFSTIKAHHFDNAHRDKIFHYAIWGAASNGDSPGRSDFADDFLVSFDKWGTALDHPTFMQSVRSQVEELAHELGHDLGLHHGGATDDDHAFKPNHWSVMTYTRDKRTGFSNAFRLGHATCPPFYYGKAGANESAMGDPPEEPGTAVDYSSGMGKTLTPPGAGAAPVTVCGMVVDWTSDGNSTSIDDPPDWPRLLFDGPKRNGWLTP
jgi:hypothetical protein